MTASLPSQEYLLKTFRYEPDSGRLYWRRRADARPQWNAKYAGKEAGNYLNRGRVGITLAGLHLRAHRVIWKMMHGTEPVEIDHIDCDGHNNKLANLRECTRAQNMQNRKGRAKSGYKGVTWHAQSGRWNARIYAKGKQRSLGYYDTPEEANSAYADAAKLHFGEFARTA